MLANKEIIKAFINGVNARNMNLRSVDGKLINYSTTIAQKMPNGKIIMNSTRYSVSTSKIQSYARYEIGNYIEVRNVPIDTYDLTKYVNF